MATKNKFIAILFAALIGGLSVNNAIADNSKTVSVVRNVDPALIGRWAVVDGSAGSLPGMIVFEKNGKMELDPFGSMKGYPGNWTASSKNLTMAVPELGGVSKGSYTLEGRGKNKVLTVVFENGTSQKYRPIELAEILAIVKPEKKK